MRPWLIIGLIGLAILTCLGVLTVDARAKDTCDIACEASCLEGGNSQFFCMKVCGCM